MARLASLPDELLSAYARWDALDGLPLVDLDPLPELLVLVADELDQLLVRQMR